MCATSATIEDAADLPTGYALVNGRRAVYILATKRADASTMSVIDEIKSALPKMQAELPSDIKVCVRIRSVTLRDPRHQQPLDGRAARRGADGLDGAAVPARLAERAGRGAEHSARHHGVDRGLLAVGQTINLMTLGGLALAVGILVDEATVEIENIHTQYEQTDSVRSGRAVRKCSNRRSAVAGHALHPGGVRAVVLHARGAARACSCRCRWRSALR